MVLAIVQLLIVLANVLRLSDILLLFFMPARMLLRKALRIAPGDLVDVELALVSELSQQATTQNIILNWNLYDEG